MKKLNKYPQKNNRKVILQPCDVDNLPEQLKKQLLKEAIRFPG